MTTSRAQRIVLTGAAAIGLTLGGAGIAAAATSPAPPATAPAVIAPAPATEPGATVDAPDHEGNDENPTYTSSITTPDTENENGLDALATVTPDDVIAAAQTATGGTATHAELENENGNVVYDVEVALADGTSVDVKVDAGNAAVLAQQADDGRESETNDSETTSENDHAEQNAPAQGANP